MRNKPLLLLIIITALSAAPAAGAFRDVPDGHWGNVAIDELVSRGITQGYPDGTFRGDRRISRWETAVFLSKLERITMYNSAVAEKLVEELKVELEKIRKEFNEYRSPSKETGLLEASATLRARVGHQGTSEGSGLKTDFRFSSVFIKEFGKDLTVKVLLDTLDAGDGFNERGLVKNMLAVESKALVNVLGYWGDLDLSAGPGLTIHREPANFAADDFTAFRKPYNSARFSTRTRGYYISAFYAARSLAGLGYPHVNDIGVTVGLPKAELPYVGELEVFVTPRHVFKNQDTATFECNATRTEVKLVAAPSHKLYGTLLMGARIDPEENDSAYAGLEITFDDYFNTGTHVNLSANRVGSNYRILNLDKYQYDILDSFDRMVLDGTSDFGLEIAQKINDFLKIYVKGELLLDHDLQYGKEFPGSSETLEEGILVYVPSGMTFKMRYKTRTVPSGTADAADPALTRSVARHSNIFETSMNYTF